jgi:thiamine-phosphate pyrophosphorylase
VLDGADYLGVGPVFPSGTKKFSAFAGLDFVREVAAEIRLPWFAIGGITPENIAQVKAAGAIRVAVSGAIATSEEPGAIAARLNAALQ